MKYGSLNLQEPSWNVQILTYHLHFRIVQKDVAYILAGMSVAMVGLDCDYVSGHLCHAVDCYLPLCHVAEMSLVNSGDRYRTGAE